MVSQVAAAVNGVVEKQAAKIRSKNQLRRLKAKQKKAEAPTDEKASAPMKGEVIYSDDDMESGEDSDEEKKSLSKKKQRKLARLTVVELKQLIKEPEVVEWTWDTACGRVPRFFGQWIKERRHSGQR
ncbi:hypothetical protein C0993_011409 [Termitomyces sp. T159_Od127]|nr:hypothetical protein C0993_011409 [Termitomyces sp. T159_Od127]